MSNIRDRLRSLERRYSNVRQPNAVELLTDRELDEIIVAHCGASLDKPPEEMTDRQLSEALARGYGLDAETITGMSDEDLDREVSTRLVQAATREWNSP